MLKRGFTYILTLIVAISLSGCKKNSNVAAYFKMKTEASTSTRFVWTTGFLNMQSITMTGRNEAGTVNTISIVDDVLFRFINGAGVTNQGDARVGKFDSNNIALELDAGTFPFAQSFFLGGTFMGASDTLILEIHFTEALNIQFSAPSYSLFNNDFLFGQILIDPNALFVDIRNDEIESAVRHTKTVFISGDNNRQLFEKIVKAMGDAFSVTFARE